MADEKEEQSCSCTGWKISFAICLVCSVIMLILCIILFVKRNVIHNTIYDKFEKHIQDIKDKRAKQNRKLGYNNVSTDNNASTAENNTSTSDEDYGF